MKARMKIVFGILVGKIFSAMSLEGAKKCLLSIFEKEPVDKETALRYVELPGKEQREK